MTRCRTTLNEVTVIHLSKEFFQFKIFAILFFSAFLFSDHPCFAQKYSTYKNASKRSLKAYGDASQYVIGKNYSGASKTLEELTAADPTFIDAWIMLGEVYKEQGNYVKAKESLEKAISLDPAYSWRELFFLAQCDWNLDNYDDCISNCQQFLSLRDISKERERDATRMLANAGFAKEAVKTPVPFDPKNLGSGINTEAPEYLPSLTGDEQAIIFTRRVGTGKYSNEDFFVSYRKNSEWMPAQNIGGINTADNEGAQCISPDGNTIYFAACNRPDGAGSCDIYYSQRSNDQWSRPKNMGAPVNSVSWESQPSISADGKSLYFTSTRVGGKGGSDIWVSYKNETGSWELPVNLGDSVNSPFDEKSPFIHPDGSTLYFSSNGRPCMGGDDIFYSRKKNDGTWSAPVNLGYPINTKNDENSFIVSLNGQHAYFSSDRIQQKHSMDLYEFDLYDKAQPNPVTYVKGKVADAGSGLPIAATIQLIDLDNGKIIMAANSDPNRGNYLVSIPAGKNYALNVAAKGYLFYSENFSLKEHNADKPYLIDVALKPIEVGSSVILKNIFFETDSYVLKDQSKAELNKLIDLLKQNTSLKIQVTGHTDDQGSDDHNQRLSENRAKSVYDYLVANGISPARLSFKGFGKTKPIASNSNEEGKAQNRRTEFTVTAQ
ncbi:MAG: PD40 domain-containing protein [Chitinophagales bacterium]|nr:PD40 domain-containing protein [Chitinophagales bacterium]